MSRGVRRKTTATISAVAGAAALTAALGVAATQAGAAASRSTGQARPDSYQMRAGHTLTVTPGHGVLANDNGDLTTVVSHTDPSNGTLTLNPDGSFHYTPDSGFTGTDTFTYATDDAVHLYQTHLPPLATIGGVKITGGAYGSSFTPKPGSDDVFYGLTDRGPNVDGPGGTKVEPMPDFTPAIGEFRLVDGKANLIRQIPLHATDGTPYNGRVNCQASTGETITDLDGNTLPCSDTGYDSEGLVAMPDGTFWVSDEYGPFITHFDRDGKQIGRLSPFDHSLPRELANRVPNKGMEGLTLEPNGHVLVGMMQSALQQPDLTAKYSKVTALRIVTIDLHTYAEHEYVYLLTDPSVNSGAVSEITALNNHQFIVDERDGNFEPNAYKELYKIDIAGATDVGPAANVPNTTYEANNGGLLIGSDQQSIEQYVGTDDTTDAEQALENAGITPVSKTLYLDASGLVSRLDPSGGFFGHDKVEGVASLDHGSTLVLSNDNDFGIAGLTNSTPPFQLQAKILPNGQQDDGEYLAVQMNRLNDPVTTTTVTILVQPGS